MRRRDRHGRHVVVGAAPDPLRGEHLDVLDDGLGGQAGAPGQRGLEPLDTEQLVAERPAPAFGDAVGEEQAGLPGASSTRAVVELMSQKAPTRVPRVPTVSTVPSARTIRGAG